MFECAYLVDPGIGTKGAALMLEEIAGDFNIFDKNQFSELQQKCVSVLQVRLSVAKSKQ